jgi:MoxR-like ATPase
MVNAALMLRRPLLVTGNPGTGKSTLAAAVAYELNLGEVLTWPITTKTTLQGGLYHYDAIGRLSDAAIQRHKRAKPGRADGSSPTGVKSPKVAPGTDDMTEIGQFLRLGPLGTALLPSGADRLPQEPIAPTSTSTHPVQEVHRPRVLLIDEIDKGDIDLPNDLLHVFELGRYEIPELVRLPERYRWIRVRTYDEDERYAWIERGRVVCDEFPLVIMTSNGEREFPPAFLRRCLRLEMSQPNPEELRDIVLARLKVDAEERDDIKTLIKTFCDLRDGNSGDLHKRDLAIDQLLNAVYLVMNDVTLDPIRDALFKTLSGPS